VNPTNDPGGQPPNESGRITGGEVGVDGALLTDLATCYAQYRRALAGPFDPVKTLVLTGDVLQSVRTILTTIGQAPGQCLPNPGKETP
jgi:hypothetical protein